MYTTRSGTEYNIITEPKKDAFLKQFFRKAYNGDINWKRENFKINRNSASIRFFGTEKGMSHTYVISALVSTNKEKDKYSLDATLHLNSSSGFIKIATWKMNDVKNMKDIKEILSFTGENIVFPFESNYGKNIVFLSKKDESGRDLYNYTRLTRQKRTWNASEIEFFIIKDPAYEKDFGYIPAFKTKDLETGEKTDTLALAGTSNESKDRFSPENAVAILNANISNAKEQKGYVDENSLLYIPEGVNKENWDFEMNNWKKEPDSSDNILQEKPQADEINSPDTPIEKYKINLKKLFGKEDIELKKIAQEAASSNQIALENIRQNARDLHPVKFGYFCDFINAFGNTAFDSPTYYKNMKQVYVNGKYSLYSIRIRAIYLNNLGNNMSAIEIEIYKNDENSVVTRLRIKAEDIYSYLPFLGISVCGEIQYFFSESIEDINYWRKLKKDQFIDNESPTEPKPTEPNQPKYTPLMPKVQLDKLKRLFAQNNYEGYFSGEVPEWAASLLGTTQVEASQIYSTFGRANESVQLVSKFAPDFLRSIAFIFNFSKGGAYGVFIPELDRVTKTNALKKQLEQKGYTITEQNNMLIAVPKEGEVDSKKIDNEIETLWNKLNAAGGVAIGLNVQDTLSASRSNADKIVQQMQSSMGNEKVPDKVKEILFNMLAIHNLACTIVHEASHARGGDEGQAGTDENNFRNGTQAEINRKYQQELKANNLENFYSPLETSNQVIHAKSFDWYKVAREEQIENKSTQELIDIFTKKFNKNITRLNSKDWEHISQYKYLTEDFIRMFHNKVHWGLICTDQILSEPFIREFKDEVNWFYISYYQALSESFIKEFKDKVDWNNISYAQKLSEPFIKEFKNKVGWNWISFKQKLSKEFIEEFKDKIDLKEYYLHNPYVIPQDKIKYMRQNGFIEQFDPNKHLLQSTESTEEPKNNDLQKFKELLGNKNDWYKMAQNMNYIPQQIIGKPTGSDLKGRYNGQNQTEGKADWSMLIQRTKNEPIEKRLSREFMFPLEHGLDQENDIIEEQLRKQTKNDYPLNPKLIMEELLRPFHNDSYSYQTTETLLEDNRPKPLILPIKKASLNKVATLFGWFNNLTISDGNTIPGLGDRVMAWEDRDEDFAWSDEDIASQPRYNQNYDLKGFYYRIIEPRFKPQLWTDMAQDFTNTTPAKRFAGKLDNDMVKIINILGVIQRNISEGNTKATRIIATEDIAALIVKFYSGREGIATKQILIKNENNENIFAIWIFKHGVSADAIKKAEDYFQRKDCSKEVKDIAESIVGYKSSISKTINEIVEKAREVCKENEIDDLYIAGSFAREKAMKETPSSTHLSFICNSFDKNIKIGEILAEKLGSADKKLYKNSLTLYFTYKGIGISFQGKIDTLPEVKSNNPIIKDIYNRDFTVNMLVYNVCEDRVEDLVGVSKDLKDKIIRTKLDPDLVLKENPLLIFNALMLKLRYGFDISEGLQISIIENVPFIFDGRYSQEKISLAKEMVREEGNKEAEELFKEFNLNREGE